MSEFAQITGFMADSKHFPEPANAVSASLGLANLDFLKFVPSVCVYPDLDYYNALLVKTIGPLVVVALFWAWPLSKAIQGKPYAGSRVTAAKMSLVWLELVLISVSTTIMQCFRCTDIGGRLYLRAQLTLPCNGTGRRKAHVFLSVLMVLLYPIGRLALLSYKGCSMTRMSLAYARVAQVSRRSFSHFCTRTGIRFKPSWRPSRHRTLSSPASPA